MQFMVEYVMSKIEEKNIQDQLDFYKKEYQKLQLLLEKQKAVIDIKDSKISKISNDLAKEKSKVLKTKISFETQKSELQEKEKLLKLKDKIINKQSKVISSKDKQLDIQKNRIKQLLDDKKKLNIKIKELIEKIDNKNRTIRKENFNRYVAKSEKTKELLKESRVVQKKSQSKKRGRPLNSKNFNFDFSSCEILHDIEVNPEEFDNAINKDKYIKIGEDVAYKVVKGKVVLGVDRIRRIKYKNKDTGKIIQAPSDHFWGNSPISNSLVAYGLDLKYELSVPITSLSTLVENEFSLTINESDWCNYFEKSAEFLKPLYDEIQKEFINPQTGVIHLDETHISLSKPLEDMKKSFVLVGCSTIYEIQIKFYKYLGSRKIENSELLKDFHGIICCDDFKGYDANINQDCNIQRCWVHARRYVADIIKGIDGKAPGEIQYWLRKINELIDVESDLKNANYDTVLKKRKTESSKILKEIFIVSRQFSKSNIEACKKAANYILNNKEDLSRFLDNPYIPIHNNDCERTVKEFVKLRKNGQTFKNEKTAQNSAIILTIVKTLTANRVDVEAFFNYAFEHYNELTKNPSKFLPRNKEFPKELIKIK